MESTFLDLYAEGGMIAVVGAMAVFMIVNQVKQGNKLAEGISDLVEENASQSTVIKNVEGILIKLLDRIQRESEQATDERSRRHEDLIKEISDLTADLAEVKGNINRLNGRT